MDQFGYTMGPGLVIWFDAKPAPEVIDFLKRHGMRWDGRRWWRRKIQGAGDVVGMLREMLNPQPHRAECWGCGSPDGTFRNCGAATPVWCDDCWAKYLEDRYRQYPWLRPKPETAEAE